MEKVLLSAPFAKTIETEDGGREVYGFATLEVKDKSGEIADFAGTLTAFEKWSNDTEQRTGGKSKGNVRVMHQPITAGKTIDWRPTETVIQDEDGNNKTVKGIWVGAYIPPTKPDVIRDIDEGILSAFSIGGSYQKRWWDDQSQAFRFIPELSEYSLVDNPCVPGADIMSVIQKADVPWNRKEGAEMSEEIMKDHSPKGGENTMTKGEKQTMDVEKLTKAAEQAGLTMEQVQSFLKALTPQDQPPAPVSASTVDGDGDNDDNKEFPNPPEGDEKINIDGGINDVKAAEKDTAEKSAEVDLEKADVVSDDDQPDDGESEEKCAKCGGMHKTADCTMAEKAVPTELEKAGKSISNKNGVHLQHAANHIDAVVKGADYTHEDHLVVEGQYGQGGTGEEAPEVDVEKVFSAIFTPIIEATVAKALEGQMQKAANSNNSIEEIISKSMKDQMENSVSKSISGLNTKLETLEKAIGKVDEIEKLVKEIHETPQAGGPLLNGGNPAFMLKDVSQANVTQMEEQALENLIQKSADPVVKDRLSQELAMRKAKQIFR
jgi:hypothetical protein